MHVICYLHCMKRRAFVKSSLVGVAGIAATQVQAAPGKNAGPEYYELRTYTLANDTQQQLVEDFYKSAMIPALNRLGVKKVGVFSELKPTGQTKLFVLIPYNSMEHFNKVLVALDEDTVYKKAGSAYLQAPASNPAYTRIESSFLKAFAGMPVMEAPPANSRIFELRQYQSASEAAGKKKIEMFNDKGEIAIFKRLDFKPVFFAETIIGSARPNLTYMITFDDMASHDSHWKAFGSDPEWKQTSAIPEYADALIISKIVSTFLQPAAYSQV